MSILGRFNLGASTERVVYVVCGTLVMCSFYVGCGKHREAVATQRLAMAIEAFTVAHYKEQISHLRFKVVNSPDSLGWQIAIADPDSNSRRR